MTRSKTGYGPDAILADGAMSLRQWAVVGVCAFVNAVDGFDILAISFAAPGLAVDWAVSHAELGIVLSLELFGIAIASLLFGGTADRIGRRRTIVIALGAMTISMGLSGLTRNVIELGVLRLAAGGAIGILMPALTALTAESANDRSSDMAVTWLGVGYSLGAITAGLMSAEMLKLFDWRAIFLVGALASSAALVLVLTLVPESVAYLWRSGKADALAEINATLRTFDKPSVEAGLTPLKVPDRGRERARFSLALVWRTLPLALIYGLHMSSFYFLLKWFPKIAVDFGFPAVNAAGAMTWINACGAVGSFVFGFLALRFGLQRMTIVTLLASALLIAEFGRSGANFDGLALRAALACLFANAGVAAIYAVLTRSFSPNERATGTGIAFGLGRGISAVAPIAVGYLFDTGLNLPWVAALAGLGSLFAALMIWKEHAILRDAKDEGPNEK